MDTNLAQPISSRERLINIDIIRGVALLAILLMNVQTFSMIFSAYSNPTSFGDLTGINLSVFQLSHLFADQKFMTIFSTLFGVGIILMAENIKAKGGNPTKVHYKRMFILALFGLLHAYLLWFGDILFPYALAGMLAYLARNKSVSFLIITGGILIALCSLLMLLTGLSLPYWEQADLHAVQMTWQPTAELIEQDLLVNQASWLGQMEHRHSMALEMQAGILFYLPRIVGLMMFGMALFKLDFFGSKYKSSTLLIGGILTFASSVLLITYGSQQHFATNWGIESMFVGIQYNYWGSITMAYSYLCFLLVFCRSNAFAQLKDLLANVGKMALTNYLSHTIICGLIFYGWGFGFYGSFERFEQVLVVVVIWIFQLIFSTYWMNRFKFGPFEWLWRSMTYGKLQRLAK
jgi:uncharacterized protein